MADGLINFIEAYNNFYSSIKSKEEIQQKTLEDLIIYKDINPSLINDTILKYYKNVKYDDITDFVNMFQDIEEEMKIDIDELFITFINNFKIDNTLKLLLVRKNIYEYTEYLYEKIEGLSISKQQKNILKKKLNEYLESRQLLI